MSSILSQRRTLGFDLIRIVSMVAIITFHVNEAIFWQDFNPILDSLYVYRVFHDFSHHISFSGFTIIALSFFLMGKGSRKNFVALMGFIFVGILVVAAFQEDPPFTGFYWEWDIYSFLLVSVAVVQILVFLPRAWYRWFTVLAFLATWIPVWRLVPNSADPISQAFVGICPPLGVASWPLLPWLAWPILFFSLGGWYQSSEKIRAWARTSSRGEAVGWIILLVLSLPYFGAFNWVPIGPNFYCHTLRIEPYLFWSTMIWVIFAMRVSMLDRVNLWLEKKTWALAISEMRWNRSFGLTYMTHLVLLGLGIYMRPYFPQHPWLFEVYYLSILPSAEGLVRLGEKYLAPRHNRIGAK